MSAAGVGLDGSKFGLHDFLALGTGFLQTLGVSVSLHIKKEIIVPIL